MSSLSNKLFVLLVRSSTRKSNPEIFKNISEEVFFRVQVLK